jgi:hypothetical protein
MNYMTVDNHLTPLCFSLKCKMRKIELPHSVIWGVKTDNVHIALGTMLAILSAYFCTGYYHPTSPQGTTLAVCKILSRVCEKVKGE